MAPDMLNPGAGDAGARDCLARRLDGPDNSPHSRALQPSVNIARRRRDPRWEHLCRRVHALGPRPMAELLGEIGAATGRPELVAARVEAFARLEPETLRALGAADFPPLPMEPVR